MADAAYVDSSVQAAPKAYTLAESQELLVKAFRAAVDGSGSTASFLPTLQLIAPSGAVMWESAPTTPVAAGGSADVSWFPGGDLETTGSASGSGGLTVLYDSGYLGANQASIDTGAGGIASGHFSLLIVAYLRSTAAVSSDNVLAVFNNDASAVYNASRIQSGGGAVAGLAQSLATSALIGNCPAASDTAKVFGALRGIMPAYDGTTNFKSGVFESGSATDVAGNQNNTATGISYESATAISQIKLVPGTGGASFLAGSRLVVYGMS